MERGGLYIPVQVRRVKYSLVKMESAAKDLLILLR